MEVSGKHIRMISNTFVRNRATRGEGGAMCSVIRNGTLSISNSTFRYNVAAANSGVMSIDIPWNNATLIVDGSTFEYNRAGMNGGVFYTGGTISASHNPITYIISQSIFVRNQAGVEGGVIYLIMSS